MDEARLIEKLTLLEALFAGATTAGEREAASRGRERIMARLREAADRDPPIEYKFTLSNRWSRRVLVTLLRRYEIRPYRYKRQRHTTVMARVPESFVEETLWPQFERFNEILTAHLTEVTDRVVAQVLDTEVCEADVVDGPRQLSLGAVDGDAPGPSPPTRRPPARAGEAGSNSSGAASSPAAPQRPATTQEPRSVKVPRNAPCPCGSGKKYKRCCGSSG